MKTIAIASRKVEESKIACPKGIFTKEEFLEMVKVVNWEMKRGSYNMPLDTPRKRIRRINFSRGLWRSHPLFLFPTK